MQVLRQKIHHQRKQKRPWEETSKSEAVSVHWVWSEVLQVKPAEDPQEDVQRSTEGD